MGPGSVQLFNSASDQHRLAGRRIHQHEPNHAYRDRLRAGKIGQSAQVYKVREVRGADRERSRQQHSSQEIVIHLETAIIPTLHHRARRNPRSLLSLPLEHDAMHGQRRRAVRRA